jgi:hypothetical protein
MLRKLAEIAKDKRLERLVFEVVPDYEPAAFKAARLLGFAPLAVLKGHVRDLHDAPHDLVVLEAPVRDIEPDLPEVY